MDLDARPGEAEQTPLSVARTLSSIMRRLANVSLAAALVFGTTACSDSDSDDAVEQEVEEEGDEAEAELDEEAEEIEAELDEEAEEIEEELDESE